MNMPNYIEKRLWNFNSTQVRKNYRQLRKVKVENVVFPGEENTDLPIVNSVPNSDP